MDLRNSSCGHHAVAAVGCNGDRPGLESVGTREEDIMQYYTPEEVANILKVKKNTVWAWLREGSLKGRRVNGKIWRITPEQLEEFVNGGGG